MGRTRLASSVLFLRGYLARLEPVSQILSRDVVNLLKIYVDGFFVSIPSVFLLLLWAKSNNTDHCYRGFIKSILKQHCLDNLFFERNLPSCQQIRSISSQISFKHFTRHVIISIYANYLVS